MGRNKNGDLPEELVHEILLMLPVKTLLVCKCVCKEWCALINSPSFVKQHYSHESNEDSLLFLLRLTDNFDCRDEYAYAMYKDDESHSLVEVPSHLQHLLHDRAKQVMGPENGIFCVVSNHNRIGLLNPATREFKMLPPHPFHDPFKIIFVIGFGSDPSSGDLKVVAFVGYENQNLAFVYNLSTGSLKWKSIQAVEALDLFVFINYKPNSRSINGVNHWVVKFVNRNVTSILALDMRDYKIQEISIPGAVRDARRDLQITAYGDSLGLMSIKYNEGVDLWVMGRDGSWSKSFSIGHPSQESVRPLSVWKKDMFFFYSSSTKLGVCDIPTNKVMIIIPGTDAWYVCGHFIYKESLASIKGDGVDLEYFYTSV